MSTGTQDVESALIESVCERVRERVAPEDVADAEAFVRQYYRRAPAADLKGREPVDLYGAALAHRAFGAGRADAEVRVRAYNPTFEQHGWQSPHTAIDVVSDDMPFLVDSVSMELSRRELGIHVLVHPVVNGESYMHIEVDRQASGFEELEQAIERVLDQVRAAVEDWPRMREHMHALIEEPIPAGLNGEECEEARALLAWIADHHFTYLGYREYELTEDSLRAVEGSGLGLLRGGTSGESTGFAKLPLAVRALAREPDPVVLAKATTRSPIHRPAYLDYIGVKKFDGEGNVIGERRFLGLYTTGAYREVPANIPVLRRKAAAVRERAGFTPGSHDDKALISVIDTFPRDELFQIGVDDLYEMASGILELGERQRVRLFMRTDRYERFVSCLVFIPRDRFNTHNRKKIGQLLSEALGAESLDWGLRLTEWVLVRIHYTLHLPADVRPEFDVEALEARIVEAVRSWDDDLLDALLEECGEERGMTLYRQYGSAFPPQYREDLLARSAVADILRIETLTDEDALDLSLYRPLEAQPGQLRCKVYRRGERVSLSDVLPMFESLDLTVTDERPYLVTPREGPPAWLYDFGLQAKGDTEIDVDAIRDRFHEGFERVWRGEAEQDGFNGLILGAGLDWREVMMLRAVARYLRQAGIPFSDRYMEATLLAHADVAGALIELFRARFDPDGPRGGASAVAERIETAIDAVDSLDEDRILRGFLSVVTAMLRTNYFLPGPKPYISFKLDPHQVPLTPLPRPRFEIFVHSPRVEGVHLRGGAVARGGLRWSDRREDFRTEILGLMKAQMVKNAVIVPVGSKGGFVMKRAGDVVVEVYKTFLSGLLDVTDNIVGDAVVPPSHVVRADGDDPYLVVAADKGTATFSDIANGVANDYGFWLGDAFASGGSVGYDHKAMGITARSAWVSVQRHFRELGVDVQAEDFTVAGVGDMSGDVFGNGMMLSPHIRLVAAFDHRHIFLDPDPDPAAGLAERERLFALPRSSWDDYDRSLISEGGGVFPRTAKSIELTEPVRAALDVDAERLTPSELIQAILRAPVDLLWNGGIGTYVKAAEETHADVGDKANDPVRVNGRDLRARVVGEGGNLGCTQRGRIEFAAKGGRINTDAIDNAGGVNCSDHEVNIKVLLDSVVAAGDMTVKQRNALLAEMTEAVGARVLRGSYTQTQALSLARFQAPAMLDVHDRFMRDLEAHGRLDRAIEALPDAEAIAERRQGGLGLTQPELAVVLAYSKITLYAALLDSDLPDDPALEGELAVYFPPPLPERYGEEMKRHRLRREIIATRVANQIVDRAGTTFMFRLREDTGATHADIARASVISRDVFDMQSLWADVEALDGAVTADTQTWMLLSGRRMVERATRWLLRTRPRPMDIGAEVARFADGVRAVSELLPGVLVEAEQAAWRERVAGLTDAGVPEALTGRVASQSVLFSALDVVEVAGGADRPVEEVAALHFELGGRLHLHWLRDQIALLTRDTRWSTMARAALRDDLFSLHADLTREVLRYESLQAWVEANRAAVERAQEILGEIRAGGAFDLTTLPVALREVRNLIQPRG